MENECNERSAITKKVGVIGLTGNLILFIIKTVVAFISKSQAMLADSINSATDILASLMTVIGGKISGTPSDEEHNYGHGKAEYIFSMLISVLTVYLAIKVFADGIKSLINHNVFEFSVWIIVVCLITIAVKISLFIYAKRCGKKEKNILILANAQDHINDVMITSSVLIGTLGALLNIYWLDGVVAMLIAVRIAYVGCQFFIDSYSVLMDSSMKEGEKQIIREIIEKHGEIDHIDSITSKSVGNKFIVIVKVSVNENMTVKDSHKIAGIIKAKILEIENVYDVIVHINPCE